MGFCNICESFHSGLKKGHCKSWYSHLLFGFWALGSLFWRYVRSSKWLPHHKLELPLRLFRMSQAKPFFSYHKLYWHQHPLLLHIYNLQLTNHMNSFNHNHTCMHGTKIEMDINSCSQSIWKCCTRCGDMQEQEAYHIKVDNCKRIWRKHMHTHTHTHIYKWLQQGNLLRIQQRVADLWDPRAPLSLPDTSELLWLYHIAVQWTDLWLLLFYACMCTRERERQKLRKYVFKMWK